MSNEALPKKCLVKKKLLQQPLIIICQEIIAYLDSFSHTTFIKRYPPVKLMLSFFSASLKLFFENKDFTIKKLKVISFLNISSTQKHYGFHFLKTELNLKLLFYLQHLIFFVYWWGKLKNQFEHFVLRRLSKVYRRSLLLQSCTRREKEKGLFMKELLIKRN